MEFVDIVFPLNLGPLTYKAPEGASVRPGTVVSAEIKKTATRGVVLGPTINPPIGPPGNPPKGRIKEIREVFGDAPVLSPALMKLIVWMAGYYFINEGTVLNSILPPEFFKLKSYPAKNTETNSGGKYYKTFLLHAPSTEYEVSYVAEAAKDKKNIIILCPENMELSHIEESLKPHGSDRLVLYHGGLSTKKRREAIERIIGGNADIVLGNRSAVFAPLREVSMIAVLREESVSYKEERGTKYNARDMAVMRGYLEGAEVCLSSILPSVESYHNAQTGKYSLVCPVKGPVKRFNKRPKVRVLDVRKTKSPVSPKLRQAVERTVKGGGRALFVINRKGFSMLRCRDCHHTETCGRCGIPLEFYRADKTLRCRYCAAESRPPEVCPRCGGLMEPSGAGIERIEEELKALHPLGIRGVPAEGVLEEAASSLIIGTKAVARGPSIKDGFTLAGILNADSYLFVPDFRAAERAFADMLYTAGQVKPGGELFVQTRNPQSPLIGYLRRYDFKRFYDDELAVRKSLGYPPFAKTALITSEKEFQIKSRAEGVEVLGPVESVSKRGKKVYKTLIKAPNTKQLHTALKGISAPTGTEFSLDIDPIAV